MARYRGALAMLQAERAPRRAGARGPSCATSGVRTWCSSGRWQTVRQACAVDGRAHWRCCDATVLSLA